MDTVSRIVPLIKVTRMDTELHIMPLITVHSIWLGELECPRTTAIGFSFTGGKAALEDFNF